MRLIITIVDKAEAGKLGAGAGVVERVYAVLDSHKEVCLCVCVWLVREFPRLNFCIGLNSTLLLVVQDSSVAVLCLDTLTVLTEVWAVYVCLDFSTPLFSATHSVREFVLFRVTLF